MYKIKQVDVVLDFLRTHDFRSWTASEIWDQRLDKSRFDVDYIRQCLSMLYKEGFVSKDITTDHENIKYRILN